jgi:UDP-2,3-diacylglucosamine pyrophosphatase LpxH
MTKPKYRTLFLSDIHLGYPLCQAEALSKLLDQIDFDTLYLVGDILDLWYMQKNQLYLFNPEHIAVVEKIVSLAKSGKRVIYLRGNHDEALDDPRLQGLFDLSAITFVDHDTFITAKGKKYSVLHGDDFDIANFTSKNLLVNSFSNFMFHSTIALDKVQNGLRNLLGLQYWSLTGFAADRLRYRKIRALGMSSLEYFENAVSFDAHKRLFDGVICGHIHIPCSKKIFGVHYLNCGDWVKSCTALVENYDGTFDFLKALPGTKISK